MAEQDTDMPEGTDKIIAGAEETDENRVEADGRRGGNRTPSRSSTGGAIMDKVRNGTDKLSGQAADKARGLLGQGIERSAEALANVGRLVGDTAAGLDERLGSEYGDYARRAAGAIENAANGLAAKDPDELIDDTREFVRKSPALALAGAAIAGFVLARLVKSTFTSESRDEDDERD